MATYHAQMPPLPWITCRDAPTVQLRHTLPGGERHIDWMIATDVRGQRPLVTFRLPSRIDELAADSEIEAERIGDHRPRYLEYEGPVSGDRGAVHRVAAGRVTAVNATSDGMLIEIAWTGLDRSIVQQLGLRPLRGPQWRILCRSRESLSPARPSGKM